ncbi:MAG: cold shock domain-containing protein [Planctomycetota bacterium]
MPYMLRGKIRSINADKGFGFIKPSSGGADLFFHCSAVDAEFSDLKLEQSVEYEVDSSAEKPRAKLVVTGGKRRTKPAKEGPRSRPASEKPAAKSSTRSPSSYSPRGRPPGREIEYAFGYITKLPRKNPIGFISATSGGYEYYFEPDFVKGKKFDRLRVGDYVRFIPKLNPDDAKQPFAKAVEVVPRPINKQEGSLKRHPKARRKKPTWR